MAVTILEGDCRAVMATLPAESVNCIVTSPPYWALRDYGTEPLDWPAVDYAPMAGLPPLSIPAMSCSLGLEPTLEAFIGHMVLVFREAHRVLRRDGTLWVNMGDSYSGERREGKGTTASRRRDDAAVPRSDVRVAGVKHKNLLGQPWRVALALQADGWNLRSNIIWNKRNPMPESAKDRPTTAHEHLFLMSRSERYYYDHRAIMEPASENTHPRRAAQKTIAGWASGPGAHRTVDHARDRLDGAYADGKSERMGRTAGWRKNNGVGFGHGSDAEQRGRGRVKVADHGEGIKANASFDAAMAVMPAMRNKRSVWTLSTEPFREAHFATFPTGLVEPCILAGCPHGGTVLDPFGGSGTTGVVADRLLRNAILIELKPQYAAMSRRRVKSSGKPLFTEVTACP